MCYNGGRREMIERASPISDFREFEQARGRFSTDDAGKQPKEWRTYSIFDAGLLHRPHIMDRESRAISKLIAVNDLAVGELTLDEVAGFGSVARE